jgi:hypothetical protein
VEDGRIAETLDTSIDTIARTRKHLVEGGIDATLTRKHSPSSPRQRIFDGAAEAKLIALACSPPPEGGKRWTLTLLETAVVELNIVDRASDNTIGRAQKNALKPHLLQQWVIPPEASAGHCHVNSLKAICCQSPANGRDQAVLRAHVSCCHTLNAEGRTAR